MIASLPMSLFSQTLTLCTLGALLVACDAKPTKNAAPSSTAPSAPALTGLTATLDGAPIAFRTALVHSRGGSALQVLLSTGTPTCAQVADGSFAFEPDTISTDFTLANRIDQDGKRSWGLTRLYFSNSTKQGDHGNAEVTGGDPSKPVTVKLRYEIESAVHPKADEKAKKLVVDGTIVAQPCGVLRRDNDPTPSKQAATITIASNKFDVRGATLKEEFGDYKLELSSDGHNCTNSGQNDVQLTLTLGKKSPEVTNLFLRGDTMSTQASGDAKEKLTASYPGELPSQGPVEFDLAGKADAAGYSVELAGKVSAERCN